MLYEVYHCRACNKEFRVAGLDKEITECKYCKSPNLDDMIKLVSISNRDKEPYKEDN